MPTTDTQPALPAKRAYVAPALVVHGTVQTITQLFDHIQDSDGGSKVGNPEG